MVRKVEKRSAIMTEQFKWVDYYEEFASKLLEYRNNRKELIDKIVKVYDILLFFLMQNAQMFCKRNFFAETHIYRLYASRMHRRKSAW